MCTFVEMLHDHPNTCARKSKKKKIKSINIMFIQLQAKRYNIMLFSYFPQSHCVCDCGLNMYNRLGDYNREFCARRLAVGNSSSATTFVN